MQTFQWVNKQPAVSIRVLVCRAPVQVWRRQKKYIKEIQKWKLRQKSVELGQHILFSFIRAQILCYHPLLTSCEHQSRSTEALCDRINVTSTLRWPWMGLPRKRAGAYGPADSRDPFLEGLTWLKERHKQRFHPLPLTGKTPLTNGRTPTMLSYSRGGRHLAALGTSGLS